MFVEIGAELDAEADLLGVRAAEAGRRAARAGLELARGRP